MNFNLILNEKNNNIFNIILNDQRNQNTLSENMINELISALDIADKDNEVKEKFDAQIPLDVIERKLLELGEDFFLESLKSDNVIVVCTTKFGLEHFIAIDHHSGGYPMLVEHAKHAHAMDLKTAHKLVVEFKENGKLMYVSPKYSGDKIVDVQLANVETVVTLR